MTEEEMYNDYQERSVTTGDRASQLAWAYIAMLGCQLIGKSYFREYYVLAAGAIAYMLLSALQSLWQTVTIWLYKNICKRKGIEPEDYPSWVGGGAWFFYWLKMIVITLTTIYGIYKFIRLF